MNKKLLLYAFLFVFSLMFFLFLNQGSFEGMVTVVGTITVQMNQPVVEPVCGNQFVESGEECEQDSDCAGQMTCVICQCRQTVISTSGSSSGVILPFLPEETPLFETIIDENKIELTKENAIILIESHDITPNELGFEEEIDFENIKVTRVLLLKLFQSREPEANKLLELLNLELTETKSPDAKSELLEVISALERSQTSTINFVKTTKSFRIENLNTGHTLLISTVSISIPAFSFDRENMVVMDFLSEKSKEELSKFKFLTPPKNVFAEDGFILYKENFVLFEQETIFEYFFDGLVSPNDTRNSRVFSTARLTNVKSFEITKKAGSEELKAIFNCLNLGPVEGSSRTGLAEEKVIVEETLKIITPIDKKDKNSEKTTFLITVKNKGVDAIKELLVIQRVPENFLLEPQKINSEKEFIVLGADFIAFRIPELGDEETEIMFSVPFAISEEAAANFSLPVSMFEEIAVSEYCKVLDCNDSKPCTIDSCSNGVCTHSNVENKVGCGTGMICIAGECVEDLAEPEFYLSGQKLGVSWKWIINIALFLLLLFSIFFIFKELKHQSEIESETELLNEARRRDLISEEEFYYPAKKRSYEKMKKKHDKKQD